jgi:AraC-like DNA-binding protein
MLSQAHRGSERIVLDGGREALARTGEMIALPAGIRHRVDVVGPREVRRWAHVNYFVLDSLDLFSLFEAPVCFDAVAGSRIGDLIEDWLNSEKGLDAEEPLSHAAKLSEFGFRILGLLAPFCSPKADLGERVAGLRRLSPVIEHMRRNFGGPLDRDSMARLAFLSPTQFHLTFRKATGTSPMKFLQGIRVRHAQQALINADRKIAGIARECGYRDPYVFSKFFKRACGLSPTQYRLTTLDLRVRPKS